jgi:hypothetical protein
LRTGEAEDVRALRSDHPFRRGVAERNPDRARTGRRRREGSAKPWT